MHKIYTMALTLFSVTALARTPQAAAPPPLFIQLQQLYTSSVTPYPMEAKAVTSATAPSTFAGCASIMSTGSEQYSGASDILTVSFTRKAGMGPLQPTLIGSYTGVVFATDVQTALTKGAEFQGGKLNIDALLTSSTSSTATTICSPPLTWAQLQMNIKSGPSSDGTSYQSVISCTNGSVNTTKNFRAAGNYLVTHIQSGTDEGYAYCW
jgi:hypothetical protein